MLSPIKIKILSLLSIILFSFLLSSFLLPTPVSALTPDPQEGYYGLKDTAQEAKLIGESESGQENKYKIANIIGNLIKTVLQFIAVILLLLMLAGGFLWMTSSGEEDKVKKAKQILINAIIGLIIVICAYVLTYFIMTNVTSLTTTP